MEAHTSNQNLDTRHVDVLDGIRAFAILLVAWFHIWQQSWLSPVLHLPFLAKLGLPGHISFDCIPRGSFLFVDMLLLISAFCLFLPHARAALLHEPIPGIKTFYVKRAARILPSYYCNILIVLIVALFSGAYTNRPSWFIEDLLTTLTFTQTFFPPVLLGTALNGVLWTAAIEVQFYLLFPLLACCFRKKPLLTYLGMVSFSMIYLHLFALGNPEGLRYTLNQLPGFFGVFANGMLASYGYVLLCKRFTRSWKISLPATAISLLCVWGIVYMLKSAVSVSPVQLWQAAHRYGQSLLFTAFLLSTALSARWYRFLFSSRIAVFLSTISYNYYIWHQWLAVKLKQWRIPYWTGEQAPNFTGDRIWQWQYTLLAFFGALAVAVLATYLIERPMAQAILHKKRSRKDANPNGLSL